MFALSCNNYILLIFITTTKGEKYINLSKRLAHLLETTPESIYIIDQYQILNRFTDSAVSVRQVFPSLQKFQNLAKVSKVVNASRAK